MIVPVIFYTLQTTLAKTRWLKELVIAMRRVEQETNEFKEEYKIRSGIEATNSELKRKHNMGKVWARGHGEDEFCRNYEGYSLQHQEIHEAQRVNSLPKFQPEAIIVAKDGLLGVATVQISSSFAYLW